METHKLPHINFGGFFTVDFHQINVGEKSTIHLAKLQLLAEEESWLPGWWWTSGVAVPKSHDRWWTATDTQRGDRDRRRERDQRRGELER